MSQRPIQSLKPFPFSAEFRAVPCAQPEDRDDSTGRIALAPRELAELGAALGANGAAMAQTRLDQALVQRVEAAAKRLERAAETLGDVADLLDRGTDPSLVSAMTRQAAQALRDGQGDLFDTCRSLSGTESADTMAPATGPQKP